MSAAGMTELGMAALWYAEHDIPVFPLLPWRKNPFKDTHGFYDATTDIDQVIRWWTVNPQANIGIPTGHRSGLGVLDFDPKNGGPNRETFIEKYGTLPETAEVITGTDGRHIYFTIADGQTVASYHGTIGKGIDLQGEGAYVVAPPSIHPNGNTYTWDGLDPKKTLLSPAMLPGWLVKLAQNGNANSNGPARKTWPLQPLEGGRIPYGQQHSTLISMVGTLRARLICDEAIEACLQIVNERQCEQPGPRENISRMVRSARRWSA